MKKDDDLRKAVEAAVPVLVDCADRLAMAGLTVFVVKKIEPVIRQCRAALKKNTSK